MSRASRNLLILGAIQSLAFAAFCTDGYFGFPVTIWLCADAIDFIRQRGLLPFGL